MEITAARGKPGITSQSPLRQGCSPASVPLASIFPPHHPPFKNNPCPEKTQYSSKRSQACSPAHQRSGLPSEMTHLPPVSIPGDKVMVLLTDSSIRWDEALCIIPLTTGSLLVKCIGATSSLGWFLSNTCSPFPLIPLFQDHS